MWLTQLDLKWFRGCFSVQFHNAWVLIDYRHLFGLQWHLLYFAQKPYLFISFNWSQSNGHCNFYRLMCNKLTDQTSLPTHPMEMWNLRKSANTAQFNTIPMAHITNVIDARIGAISACRMMKFLAKIMKYFSKELVFSQSQKRYEHKHENYHESAKKRTTKQQINGWSIITNVIHHKKKILSYQFT